MPTSPSSPDPWEPTSFDADGLPQFDVVEPVGERRARLPVTIGPRDPGAPDGPPRPSRDRPGLTRPRVLLPPDFAMVLVPMFLFFAGMVDGVIEDQGTALVVGGIGWACAVVALIVRALTFKVAIEDHWIYVRRWGRWHGPVDLDRTTSLGFRTVFSNAVTTAQDLDIGDADGNELRIDARNHSVEELLGELATWFGPDDVAPSGRARARMGQYWD